MSRIEVHKFSVQIRSNDLKLTFRILFEFDVAYLCNGQGYVAD